MTTPTEPGWYWARRLADEDEDEDDRRWEVIEMTLRRGGHLRMFCSGWEVACDPVEWEFGARIEPPAS